MKTSTFEPGLRTCLWARFISCFVARLLFLICTLLPWSCFASQTSGVCRLFLGLFYCVRAILRVCAATPFSLHASCFIIFKLTSVFMRMFSCRWLTIYMKKLLHSDWLREIPFSINTMRNRGNSVQKEVTNQAFWLVNDQRNCQSNADPGWRKIWIHWKFASEAMAGVLSRFSLATATTT